MTATTGTHVDSSIQELWSKLTLRDHLRQGFWANLTGDEGSRSAIIQKNDLVSQPGDTIHIQVTNPLTGSGQTGDNETLEGSEENLTSSSKKVVPVFFRHGVRWRRRANKKSLIDLRGEARMRLAEWGGEKMDDTRFTNFTQATGLFNGEVYTPNELFCGASSTTVATVGATDVLSVEELQKIKLTLYNNKALPLKTAGGEDVFAIVCHQNAIYDLKRDTEYKDWVREAAVRGPDNPFFRGSVAMVDGMLIFQHSNVPVLDGDGEGGIDVAANIAFGAEAFIEGVDEAPSWEEDDFDYKAEFGIAYEFGFQPRRALEKNSLIVYTSAESPL